MTDYRPTPWACGTCREPLDLMRRHDPPAACYYVHRGDHRYHCHGDDGPHTASAPLELAAPVVEHATAIVAEDLPDGRTRLSRVDGTVIGPRSIVRPEARRTEEDP